MLATPRLLKIVSMSLVAAWAIAAAADVQAAEWFVAPSGNDAAAGTKEAPWKTLAKACQTARPGDTVILHAGVYREVLKPARSGEAGRPIRFQSASGERATLSGAESLAGEWQLYRGNIYSLKTTKKFTQLFVDGRMMPEARWPNSEPDKILDYNRAVTEKGTGYDALVDSHLPPGDWRGAVVLIWPGQWWWSDTRRVADYQPGKLLTFDRSLKPIHADPYHDTDPYKPRAGNYYILFGALAALDAPGEWFLDEKSGTVYLWTPDGKAPGEHAVEIKQRDYACDLHRCGFIELKDIDILGAAVNMNDAHDCLLDNCRQRYVEHYRDCDREKTPPALNVVTGRNNELRHCLIAYAGTTALHLGGENNRLTDCVLHDANYIGTGRGGLDLGGSVGAVVSHCTIFCTGRDGVGIGGSRRLRLEYNDLYNVNMRNDDAAAVYGWGTDGLDGVIAYNWVHDNYFSNGIYLDNFCKNFTVHHNVVWNCRGNAITLNSDATNHLVCNNTLTQTKKAFGTYTYPRHVPTMKGTRILNNIINEELKTTDPWSLVQGELGPTLSHNGPCAVDRDGFPTADSKAIAAGVEVPGVVAAKNGKLPDMGAYAFGEPRWKPGADWRDPDAPLPPEKNLAYAPIPPITEATMIRDGLALWLDAADAKTIDQTPEGDVAAWHDKSPKHLTAAPFGKPKDFKSVANSLAGKPVVRAGAKADRRGLKIDGLHRGPGEVTAFVVSRATTAFGPAWGRILQCFNGKGQSWELPNWTIIIPGGAHPQPYAAQVFSLQHRTNALLDRITLMSASVDVAEVLVFDRTLRFDEFEAVEKYLNAKWGLGSANGDADKKIARTTLRPAIAATPMSRLYVAVNGNDAADGTQEKPLATLAGARQKIRAMKKAGVLPVGGVTVFVRAGTYEIDKALQLTAEDAGTKDSPIVYRAAPGEKVVLTGAKAVSDFTPWKGKIVKADVGAQGFKGRYFRQLLFNGRRQTLARYPNFDALNPYGGGFAYVDGPLPKPGGMYRDQPDDNPKELHYRTSDARTWAHPELGEVSIFPRYNWVNDMVPIASVDRTAKIIHLTRGARTPGHPALRPFDRYYVRNLLEELDSPGEWYLDKETWTLYFWPPVPIKDKSVRASISENLIVMERGAAWITVQGFTMEGCDGSAVVLRGADDCMIVGNTIHDVCGRFGPAAVEVAGGHRCGVVGNDVFNAENGGIRLNGGDMRTLAPGEHFADNNYVHHIGLENGHSCGIWLGGIGQRVSHNLVHDCSRCGIFGGGPDCITEYNHVHHVNLETEDTGGRYSGGMWHIRGEIVRYNFVHDTLGYGRKGNCWVRPFFSWGIYLDDDESYTHVYGNIVARTTNGGCDIHAGRNNTIENNIFVESSGRQIQCQGHDPKSELTVQRLKEFQKIQTQSGWTKKYPDIATASLDTIWHMADNKIQRNILYYHNPKAHLYDISQVASDPFKQNEVDGNLVWHAGDKIVVSMNGKPLTWEQWQREGFDAHSVVADPLFVDPNNDDYRLKPDSPAFKLGFQPIPVDKIGPYKDERRASWPIAEAPGVRENPLPDARVWLWPDTAPVGDGTREQSDAVATVYLPRPHLATGAAVVICPGGGYGCKVIGPEGVFIAQWLAKNGIAGVVLDYRLPHGRPYVPLLDAQRAIRTVRANAAEWNINPRRIGIMGFSAGGHLASTAATHFDAGDAKAKEPVERQSSRPDFAILIYPVVTLGENGHSGTCHNLLGPTPKPELIKLFSNQLQVTEKTPPMFMAHAKDDRTVPISNSKNLYDALLAHHVPAEFVELAYGGHGLNGYHGPTWEEWKTKSLAWLAERGFTTKQK